MGLIVRNSSGLGRLRQAKRRKAFPAQMWGGGGGGWPRGRGRTDSSDWSLFEKSNRTCMRISQGGQTRKALNAKGKCVLFFVFVVLGRLFRVLSDSVMC